MWCAVYFFKIPGACFCQELAKLDDVRFSETQCRLDKSRLESVEDISVNIFCLLDTAVGQPTHVVAGSLEALSFKMCYC